LVIDNKLSGTVVEASELKYLHELTIYVVDNIRYDRVLDFDPRNPTERIGSISNDPTPDDLITVRNTWSRSERYRGLPYRLNSKVR
jgi:hypothetical protein